MSSQGKVRFGVFELDLGTGELRKSGTRIRLQEQPFQVLRALVEKPGEVVRREELQQRLWPEDTFVDFEDGLSTSVKKIRRALGDSAANPRFVETLPKRGYRFVAPVEGVEKERRTEVRWQWLPWVAVAGLAIGLAVVYSGSRESGVAVPWEPVPFTTYPGAELHPTFSPDGERVAFQWCHEGECDIYVKQVGSESRLRLTDHPDADGHPAWSPDGKRIAFLRWNEVGWSLRLVPAIGGVERELAKGAAPMAWEPDVIRWAPLIVWHPSGKWIAYADRSRSPGRVVAVSPESHERRPLTNPGPATSGDGCVAFSPEGDELLFCRVLDYTRTEIHRMRVTDDPRTASDPVRVDVAHGFMTSWAWLPNGREIVGQPGKWSPLARLELRKDAQARSLGFGRNAASVAYNSAMKRLVYSARNVDVNIWQLELDESGAAGEPSAAVTATSRDHQADLSPDGSRIAFWSDRTGRPEVWVCDADGSTAVQLTRVNGKGGISYPKWTPDGSHIVFGTNRDGDFDLYAIPVGGGEARKVLAHPGGDTHGVYAADMEALFFTSRREESEHQECYRMPAEGGEQVRLTTSGGSFCRPSLDGAYLYYSSGAEQGLWRMPIGGGEATQLTPALAGPNSFAVWRGGVYYFAPVDESGAATLFGLNPESGAKRELASVDNLFLRADLNASADGRRLVWAQRDVVGADLMLVEGFE